MAETPSALSLAQLDAILAFLPIFEQPGYAFGAWQVHRGIFPHWAPSAEAETFVQALYREQFITPFDWSAWRSEAQRYTDGGEVALADADLDTLRKLLTAYVRADRFSAGTLAAMFQNGQITAVLRRLRQIRDAMSPKEQ